MARARFGENLVATWYERNGYTVVARNWRCPRGELDIVCERGDVLVVCEVKARRNVACNSTLLRSLPEPSTCVVTSAESAERTTLFSQMVPNELAASFPAATVPVAAQIGGVTRHAHHVPGSRWDRTVAAGAHVGFQRLVRLHAPHRNRSVQPVPDRRCSAATPR